MVVKSSEKRLDLALQPIEILYESLGKNEPNDQRSSANFTYIKRINQLLCLLKSSKHSNFSDDFREKVIQLKLVAKSGNNLLYNNLANLNAFLVSYLKHLDNL